MPEKIKVGRVGSGTEEDPFRPDTDHDNWQVVKEEEDGFIIEIID